MRSSKTNLVVIIVVMFYLLTCIFCKSFMYIKADQFRSKYADKIVETKYGARVVTLTTGFGSMAVTSQYTTYFSFYDERGRDISQTYASTQSDFIDLVLNNNLVFDLMEIIGMIALVISVGPLVARIYSIKKFYDNLIITVGILTFLIFSSTFNLIVDIGVGIVVIAGLVFLLINNEKDRKYVPKYY